jgi:hypothetical protein
MAFWVRRLLGTDFHIADLGNKGIEASGGEADLHEAFSYDEIQSSASLLAALTAADLVKIDGPGGSVVPAGTEYDDAVMAHALSATDIHTGVLERAQLRTPVRTLTVASQGADYTSIKAAVDAAISGGASATTPWAIVVYPGTYAEDPMTIQNGIVLSELFSNRMDTVFVTANNAAADLFTCAGGYIAGIRASGVTDPSYALFKMATASTLTVLHGVSVRNCSTGVAISNGASVVATSFSINLTGAGQGVTTGVSVAGSNSYFALNAGFFSVPAALLPAYAGNPIQTAISISGSNCDAYIVGCAFRIAPKNATADVILTGDGAEVAVMSCEAEGCGNVLHISSAGSNTKIVCMSTTFEGCTNNVKIDSSTGTVFASYSTDAPATSLVAGAKISGLVQVRDEDLSRLVGVVKYQFGTGKDVDLADYFEDYTTTGVCDGGIVTAATGLDVDVSAGDGWIRRPIDEDAFWVSWAAVTGLTLTASSTRYVYYDSSTDAVVESASAPGDEGILFATVVTDGSGIRFLHNTRSVLDDHIGRIHQYLLDTRKRALKSGLGVNAGTGGRKFTIGSGAYYIALNPLSYAGATDATFSYFYGTNGATEVTGQTQVSNTQYDNAGTLTAMTAGYYRSDTVILTSDGRVSVIYGTAEYATQQLAEGSSTGTTPTFLDPTSFPLARLIVQEAGSIVSFIDIRPQPATGGSGSSGGVTVHSALSGLSADDHTQYLLTTGSRAMSGGLNMGTYAITNVGNVDGVDVSAHASRHNPGGVDALTTAAPGAISVGASATEGSNSSLARSDHGHSVATGAPSSIGTSNAAGASSSIPRLDHVHDHGAQSTGTHHAVATTTVNGFMSAADKVTFDDLAAGHTILTCRNETGSTIPKGTLVASAGWSGVHACPYLVVADKDDGAKRPAIGITHVAIADSTNGPVLISGIMDGVDTSTWAVTDQLVLGSAGAFSRPPPDIDPFTGEVQNVGSVTRVDATNGQIILIPDGLEVVNANQVFALVGTSGTPSKTNKYVTDADARNSNARTPVAHSSSHRPGGSDTLEWRQLTYFLDEGPAEGFVSGAYKEVTGGVFPTSVIWYDSSGLGKKKIVEKTITWSASKNPTTIVWKIYDGSETLMKTITDTITYTGVAETSRTRTVV